MTTANEKQYNQSDWQNGQNLSDKQQFLLSKHYDSECNFYERILVKRLLNGNVGAQAFLDGLKICSFKLKESVVNEQRQQFKKEPEFQNLWNNIEQRIINEEHAAKYLGERKYSPSKARNLAADSILGRATWGFGGALASFFVFYLIFLNPGVGNLKKMDAEKIDNNLPLVKNTGLQIAVPLGRDIDSNSNFGSNVNVGNLVSNGYHPLSALPNSSDNHANIVMQHNYTTNGNYDVSSLDREEIFDATPYLERRAINNTNAYKVDWLRSIGSVSLLHQQHAGAPIIWVSKRKGIQSTQPESVSSGQEYFTNPK